MTLTVDGAPVDLQQIGVLLCFAAIMFFLGAIFQESRQRPRLKRMKADWGAAISQPADVPTERGKVEERFQEAYEEAGPRCPASVMPPAKPRLDRSNPPSNGSAVQAVNGVAIVGVVVELRGRKVMLPMQWPPHGQNLN